MTLGFADFAMGGKCSAETNAKIKAKREAKEKAYRDRKDAERRKSMGEKA